MNRLVFLSWPTTSGSPPVFSISLSDQSFSGFASSRACTLAHSRPLWRFMFFSKRVFNVSSSVLSCPADNFFLLLILSFIDLHQLFHKVIRDRDLRILGIRQKVLDRHWRIVSVILFFAINFVRVHF